jgi:hypothetical protein
MSPGPQIMKTLPDALDTAENESGDAIHENESGRRLYRRKLVRECKTLKRDLTPSIPSKMSPGMQNIKTGADAVGNAENYFGSVKH